jgi:hypothetical protein
VKTDRAQAPVRTATRAASLAALLLATVLVLPAAALPAEGPAPSLFRGRLVDGASLIRGVRPSDVDGPRAGGDFLSKLERSPLSNRKFRLHITDGPGRGRNWPGTTDAEGRFTLPLDVQGLPEAPCLVAEVEGSPALYSTAVRPSAEEVEFRAYPTTESPNGLRGSMLHVYHALLPNPVSSRLDLEVRVELEIFNAGEMYVGRPIAPRFWKWSSPPSREVLRVPVPAEASVVANRGPRGARWSEFPGDGSWKWMVIDTPVPPFTEAAGGGSIRDVWEVTYRMPASQEAVCVYPLGLKPSAFAAWAREDDMTLESAGLLHKSQQMNSLRPGEPPQQCTVLFSQDEEIVPGSDVTIGIHVDSAKLGEVNRGSLGVVMAFILGAVAAILAGLFLGRKGPSLEVVLEEATGEELIARIAQLDQRYAEKEVSEDEYRETRAKLLSMARYLVPELAGTEGPASGRSAGAVPGAEAADGLSPAARELLARLKSFESEGPLDAHRIHERALLLEELARVLTSRSPARDRKAREVGR